MSQTNQPSSNDERELFLQAIERRTSSERAAFLDGACRGDARLRAAVDALLASADNSLLDQLADEARPTHALPLPEQPGTVIGRYTLLQLIGEGGFGAVYMAEQKEPVRRRVALKIIKLGMDSQQVVARFEAERQALAMMDHPNIARVLDGGCTDTGRPYFVMELVKGPSVTQYCDEQKLSTRQRLDLFVPICQAVQHAHQKGIIHRDIKPSNILLATIDGRPVPKIIDFGIAKAMQHDLTDKIVFTQFHQFMGTPAYMSPEQAAQNSTDIDTRSDIYSLGVLLYELLTGKTPVEARELTRGGYDEIRRRIREIEPPTPSHRLSTLPNAELTTVARSRAIEPARLPKLIRGELDWIVLKALDKDRARRYETANGLAMDVRRYLDGEPVMAVKPTSIYRFQKFARRHKAGLAMAACFAVLLAVSAGVSAAQAIRNKSLFTAAEEARLNEMSARQREAELRRIAETERDRSERLLYAADMNLAKRAWDDNEVGRVVELLDLYRARPGRPELRRFEWFYLDRLCNRDLLTFRRHRGPVWSVAYSPDSEQLASAGKDGTVKLWDATSGEELFPLKGHTNGVWSVAFNSDGTRLASAGVDHTVKVWDTASGREVLTLRGHAAPVLSVAFSPDGTRLASASADATAKVWDAASGRELLSLGGHDHEVLSVAFSPDGRRLASGSKDHTVRVWDATTGEKTLTLTGHTFWVSSVAFGPDGKRLATASYDKTVKIWDATTGGEALTLKRHEQISSVAFSRDGSRLVLGSNDGTVSVWEVTNGQTTLTLKGHTSRFITSVAFSPDGRRLASTSADGAVKVWDALNAPGPFKLEAHAGVPSSADAATLWQRLPWSTLEGRVWVTFSPDGQRMASAGANHAVKVWNATTGEELLTLQGHTAPVLRVAFSSDGKRLASASADRTVKVWDASSGRETLTLQGHSEIVTSVAFSPDGRTLASGGDDTTVRVWDLTSGQETLRATSSARGPGLFRVSGVAYSPDGKRLASSSHDGTVRLWDTASGQETLTLTNHTDRLSAVAFSPDGQRLASSSWDGTVRVWDAITGQETLTLKRYDGYSSIILSVAFSPDGERLASGGNDQTVRVWDVASGQEVISFNGHNGAVVRVAFSPDGYRLASGGMDHTVKIWDATPRSGETTRAAGAR